MTKNKSPTNFQVFLGVLIFIAGIIVIYIKVFTTPEHELVMDQFGELKERDNSGTLPIMKLSLIILPVVGIYYFIKGLRKK